MRYAIVVIVLSALSLAQVVTVRTGRKLMIFGGDNHKVYLGCLSCSSFSTDSVLNTFGPHGGSFQTESVFNSFGEYGGTFSSTSPCNEFGANPPVIVDDHGGYYGELTVNEMRPKRVRSGAVLRWLETVCKH